VRLALLARSRPHSAASAAAGARTGTWCCESRRGCSPAARPPPCSARTAAASASASLPLSAPRMTNAPGTPATASVRGVHAGAGPRRSAATSASACAAATPASSSDMGAAAAGAAAARIVSTLEKGGYNPRVVAAAALRHAWTLVRSKAALQCSSG
jgi:hypothetical protein